MAAFAVKKRGGKTHVGAQKRPDANTGKQPTDASIALTPMKRPAAHRDTATGTKKTNPAPEHIGAANKTRCSSERVCAERNPRRPRSTTVARSTSRRRKIASGSCAPQGIITRRERLRIAWVHKQHGNRRCASWMRSAPSNGSVEPQAG